MITSENLFAISFQTALLLTLSENFVAFNLGLLQQLSYQTFIKSTAFFSCFRIFSDKTVFQAPPIKEMLYNNPVTIKQLSISSNMFLHLNETV